MLNHMERGSCAKDLLVIVGLHQIAIVPHSLHGRHQVVCKPLPTTGQAVLKPEKVKRNQHHHQMNRNQKYFKVINK